MSTTTLKFEGWTVQAGFDLAVCEHDEDAPKGSKPYPDLDPKIIQSELLKTLELEFPGASVTVNYGRDEPPAFLEPRVEDPSGEPCDDASIQLESELDLFWTIRFPQLQAEFGIHRNEAQDSNQGDDEPTPPAIAIVFRYGMRFRPLQLGAQPKGFCINRKIHTRKQLPQFFRWGYIDYPTKLSDEDVRAYELTYVGEREADSGEPNPHQDYPAEAEAERSTEAPAGESIDTTASLEVATTEPRKASGIVRLTKAMRVVLAMPTTDDGEITVSKWSAVASGSLAKCVDLGLVTEGKPDAAEKQGFHFTEAGALLKAEYQSFMDGCLIGDLPAWALATKKVDLLEPKEGWIVAKVKGKPWFSNTHFAVIGDAPTPKTRDLQPDKFARVIPPLTSMTIELGDAAAVVFGSKETNCVAVFADGTPVNLDYVRAIEQTHPGGAWRKDGQFEGMPSTRCLVWIVAKTIKGIVMPMSSECVSASLKEKLVPIGSSLPYKAPVIDYPAPATAEALAAEEPDAQETKAARRRSATGTTVRTGRDTDKLAQVESLILQGRGPAEVAKAVGCRRSFARRILKKELAARGLSYTATARITQLAAAA